MEEAREREEQEMKQRHKASTGTASHLACFVPQLNTGWGSRTDKSYPDGQSASSSLIIEPVAVRVCALGITLAHILKIVTQPVGRGIPQLWYWHGSVRQGSVRFNLSGDALPPFSPLL